jgi:hypothetical protein
MAAGQTAGDFGRLTGEPPVFLDLLMSNFNQRVGKETESTAVSQLVCWGLWHAGRFDAFKAFT